MKTKKTTRLISFILTLVMMFSVVNVQAADTSANAKSNQAGSHSLSSGGNIVNTSNGNVTGYKVELRFLPVTGLKLSMSPEEQDALIAQAWDEAEPDDAIQVGSPILLAHENTKGNISKAFSKTDFTYGLGQKQGSVSRVANGQPDIKSLTTKVVTPKDIRNTLLDMHISSMGNGSSDRYSDYSMSMTDNLPIGIGNYKNSGNIRDYFMLDRTEEEKQKDTNVSGDVYATPNFAGLVNYIATEAGTASNNFIYFGRIKSTEGNLSKYDKIIPRDANCFESGVYHGKTGEYRLIITPYYGINVDYLGGALTALTLRYLAALYDMGGVYKQIAVNQQPYYGDLGLSVHLYQDDIWGLKSTERGHWDGKYASDITEKVRQNFGGGIGFFTSSMMRGDITGKPNYIGSVVNVFLPGSLSSSDKDIKTAEVEYVGPKSSDTTTMAIPNAAQQIAMAISGVPVNGGNVFTDSELNQTNVLLNGTIQLPGISSSSGGFQGTLGYAEKYEAVLRAILDGAEGDDKKIDIDSGTRDAIKQILQDELGLDVDGTKTSGANAVNLQDIALAVYVLSKYQLDGVEADGSGWGDVYDNPSNRWKQIITYYDMLLNKKPQATIDASADEGTAWSGPLSITQADLKNYKTSAKFGTTSLADNSNLESYPKTSDGAQQAIEAGVLDSETTGQITTDPTKWDAVFKANDLKDGLVRVSVALGTTQVYLASTNNDTNNTLNIGKNQLPETVGSVFALALKDIRSTNNTGAEIGTLTLAKAAEKAWGKDAKIANGGRYHQTETSPNTLSSAADLGNLSLHMGTGMGSKTLFAPVVEGDAFIAAYFEPYFFAKKRITQ